MKRRKGMHGTKKNSYKKKTNSFMKRKPSFEKPRVLVLLIAFLIFIPSFHISKSL